MDLISRLIDHAKADKKRIVFPEATEHRTLRAAQIINKEGIADVILLGNESEIISKAGELKISLDHISIIDNKHFEYRDEYAELMLEIRKNNGLYSKKQALELLDNPLYFAPLMILNGDADGEIAGANNSSADVLRPALQFVRTMQGINSVSGAFIMMMNDPHFGYEGILVFADCSVIPDPDEQQLAEIAVVTAETAKTIVGMDPRVAMLSFSTKGSAKHRKVDKVVNATKIAKEIAPDIKIDGELQLDAALIPEVAQIIAPNSEVAGHANVLVFPGLESANIGYNLVHRLAKAEAIGPILQGMAAPINDLSRGCSVSDIVTMSAITSVQAQVLGKSNIRYREILLSCP